MFTQTELVQVHLGRAWRSCDSADRVWVLAKYRAERTCLSMSISRRVWTEQTCMFDARLQHTSKTLNYLIGIYRDIFAFINDTSDERARVTSHDMNGTRCSIKGGSRNSRTLKLGLIAFYSDHNSILRSTWHLRCQTDWMTSSRRAWTSRKRSRLVHVPLRANSKLMRGE